MKVLHVRQFARHPLCVPSTVAAGPHRSCFRLFAYLAVATPGPVVCRWGSHEACATARDLETVVLPDPALIYILSVLPFDVYLDTMCIVSVFDRCSF